VLENHWSGRNRPGLFVFRDNGARAAVQSTARSELTNANKARRGNRMSAFGRDNEATANVIFGQPMDCH